MARTAVKKSATKDRRYYTNAQRRAYGWPLVGRKPAKRKRARR